MRGALYLATMHLHYGIVLNHRGAVPRPCRHKLSAFFEKIASPVSRLALVRDGVRERHFAYLVREGGALRRPVAERAAEAMDRRFDPHPAERHVEGHDRQWFCRASLQEIQTRYGDPPPYPPGLPRRDPTAAPDAPERPSCVRPARSTADARSLSRAIGGRLPR